MNGGLLTAEDAELGEKSLLIVRIKPGVFRKPSAQPERLLCDLCG
jgi:hypothetical protein